MKRAILISGVALGVALMVTTSLAGCGASESEAAPIRREYQAPAPKTVAAPPVREIPAAKSTPALVREPVEAGAAPAEIPAALVEAAAFEGEATPGEIGIVPRDAMIDVGAETLARRSLLEGKLSLLVPRSFAEMGPVMLQTKYPSQNRPSLVLTNESGAVNVALNYTSNRVKQKDLPAAFNVIRAQLRNAYPTAHWYASELTTINGNPCFRLDFRTPAVDTQVRNIMIGTVVEGRLLLVSFNTTRELEGTWAPIGEAIVDSIQLD